MLPENVRRAIVGQVAGIATSVYMRFGTGKIGYGDTVLDESFLAVDPAFLTTFTLPLAAGDPESALDDPQALVLAHETAEKYFGPDTPPHAMMGQRLRLHFVEQDYSTSPATSIPAVEHSYLAAGLAALVLLVAAINFVNLSLGRAMRRVMEIGVRKATGAAPGQLSRQFLVEAVLMSTGAVLVGLTLAEALLPTFNEVVHEQLEIGWSSPGTWLGVLGLGLVVGLLAGFYPSQVAARFHPVRALAGQGRRGGRSSMGRLLIIVQFALSTFLFVVTLTMERQLDYMTTKDLGFDGDRVVMAFTDGMLSEIEIEALAGQVGSGQGLVQGVAGASPAPGYGGMAPLPIQVGDQVLHAKPFLVSADYLAVMGTKLVAGRGFEGGGSRQLPGILVNEAMARFFGEAGPIGRTLSLVGAEDAPMQVVGVVEDFHFENMRQAVGPAFLSARMPRSNRPNKYWNTLFRLDHSDLPAALDKLRTVWQNALPQHELLDVRFIDEALASRYDTERRIATVLGWMSAVSIATSCMGLFGLAALAAARRTKEIGIRKALGASLGHVLLLIGREFGWLVVTANALAWPLAWYALDRWLAAYAYRIDIGMAWFTLAGLAVLAVALATVGGQAWRAARTSPVEALRCQ
ncbi:MAG: FtsX-like permease family protein [Candidatus Latescibacteria bacterium]|nr:FtsX-like permease family protein [Candidatus Latescibacterota bacterium]